MRDGPLIIKVSTAETQRADWLLRVALEVPVFESAGDWRPSSVAGLALLVYSAIVARQ
jgi:hypothetical protein